MQFWLPGFGGGMCGQQYSCVNQCSFGVGVQVGQNSLPLTPTSKPNTHKAHNTLIPQQLTPDLKFSAPLFLNLFLKFKYIEIYWPVNIISAVTMCECQKESQKNSGKLI